MNESMNYQQSKNDMLISNYCYNLLYANYCTTKMYRSNTTVKT